MRIICAAGWREAEDLLATIEEPTAVYVAGTLCYLVNNHESYDVSLLPPPNCEQAPQ